MDEKIRVRPQRIQRKRTKGWRKPPGAVDCTRHRPGPEDVYRYGNYTAEGTAEAYEAWLGALAPEPRARFLASLRGKTLMCWCAIYDTQGRRIPCHVDVLLAWANNIPLEVVCAP